MRRRIMSLLLAMTMATSLFSAGAADDHGGKGSPPPYNKATGCYEISSPDHLLYLSGTWKDGAPRDGEWLFRLYDSPDPVK